MKQKQTFEDWMKAVNNNISAILFGVTSDDLPDVCYYDWYEANCSPLNAAKRAIKNVND